MRSTAAFIALVAFALVNTAFLGFYLTQNGFGVASVSSTTTTTGALSTAQSTMTAGTPLAPASTTTTVVSGSTSTVTSSVTTTGTVTQVASKSQALTGTATAALGTATQTSVAPSTSSAASTGAVQASASNASAGPGGSAGGTRTTGSASLLAALLAFFEDHSLILAPSSWFAVGGMWIWRGRMRSKWTELGFDSDVFTLFVRMKGAKTRIRLLDALTVPKDRLQLADELGLDWKSVDRHVAVMKKYGFVDDSVAYGRVKLYQLTPTGVSLLRLLEELSGEEGNENPSPPGVVEREA